MNLIKEKHEHDYKPVEELVPLRRYVYENGRPVRDTLTGRDTLKLWVCACGEKQGTDLTRKLI